MKKEHLNTVLKEKQKLAYNLNLYKSGAKEEEEKIKSKLDSTVQAYTLAIKTTSEKGESELNP